MEQPLRPNSRSAPSQNDTEVSGGAPLKEGFDYDVDPVSGNLIFTAEYLRRRGYCCGNGCRNCPYEGEDKRHEPVGL